MKPGLVILLALLGLPAETSAMTWWVQAGGRGTGTQAAPFGRIQDGIQAAQPGDVVIVLPGTYAESLSTVRDGAAGRSITIKAAQGRESVVVTVPDTVLTIRHSHVVVDGLVIDAQYAAADAVRVHTGGHFLVLRNSEVRRTSRDGIDISAPEGVVIERALVHHTLNAEGGRRDAHGIAAGPVKRLTIRDTEIHTFSGDAFQVDPGRSAPGWSDVTIEGCRFWLQPLPQPENGFAAGVVPGENAVDTKAAPALPRARLVIRDTVAFGFQNGLIPNMAAFNLKENIDATVDRVTVHDSEIAFRLRGGGRVTGAFVGIRNAVVYDTRTAFRYEDAIDGLRIWNSTVGSGVGHVFRAAAARPTNMDVRNLLVLGTALPPEASHSSNMATGPEAFTNAAGHDYTLAAGAKPIDRGVRIPDVSVDRRGFSRPHGDAPDVGGYEFVPRK